MYFRMKLSYEKNKATFALCKNYENIAKIKFT